MGWGKQTGEGEAATVTSQRVFTRLTIERIQAGKRRQGGQATDELARYNVHCARGPNFTLNRRERIRFANREFVIGAVGMSGYSWRQQ